MELPLVIKLGIDALKLVNDLTKHASSGSVSRRIVLDKSQYEQAVSHHMASINSWSSLIQGRDWQRPLKDMYVSLDLSSGEERRPNRDSVPVLSLLRRGEHCVILGGPGAGKTTTLKQIASHMLTEPGETKEDVFLFPIVVRLRELEKHESLATHILTQLGIRLDYHPPLPAAPDRDTIDEEYLQAKIHLRNVREQALAAVFQAIKPLVLLDGLDEVHVDTLAALCKEIERMAGTSGDGAFVITCRHGAYSTPIAGCSVYSIREFSDEQVKMFVHNWFRSESAIIDFTKCLESKPYKSLIRIPLHATNFCMIFSSYGDLPQEHTRVYEKIIDIRIREWDRERGVLRQSASISFGPDEKRRFLAACAFELARRDQGLSFDLARFESVYKSLKPRFQLESMSSRDVLSEVEAHTGILYLSGFERYDFVHKTIQEYLCGEYLSRIPIVSEYQYFLRSMPDACALATILSNDPDCMLFCLWSQLFAGRVTEKDDFCTFWIQYYNRLVSEGASFVGAKILGFGIIGAVSQCVDISAVNDSPAGLSLLRALQGIMGVPGVQNGVDEFLRHSSSESKDVLLRWGAAWRRVYYNKKIGVSESFGNFQYPPWLWVCKEMSTVEQKFKRGSGREGR